ncbi:S8 family serine peptidase [bacterium]|nr:S8 family serine peptidase [bacterium]
MPAKLTKKYSILPIYRRIHSDAHYTGKGVTIAFIDSGFWPHPDLITPHPRILAMVDVTREKFSKKDFLKVRPSSWHGTMVACSACGSGFFSKKYYRGIAADANVVLIKAFDGKKVTSADIHRALLWVLKNHKAHTIRIVNISLGGNRNDTALRSSICKTIGKLKSLGITVVAATGNNPGAPVIPPASCPDVITVGGIDDKNSENSNLFGDYGSSYGRTTDGFVKPEIVAPGKLLPAPIVLDNETFDESQILHELNNTPAKLLKKKLRAAIRRTKLDPKILTLPEKQVKAAIRERLVTEKFFAPYYQHVDGTSFAAPIVSAIIAQMLEANPLLTPGLIKMIIETTARRLPGLAPEKQGFGLINAKGCVQQALRETHAVETDSPQVFDDRIVFYYHNHTAKKVCLLGDFTAWQKDTILLKKISDGVWRADIPRLSAGQYAYKFLIDDRLWIEDPLNHRKENDHYNGMNNLLLVP